MIRLSRLGVTARDVFLTCISRIRDGALKGRLQGIAHVVEAEANAFTGAAGRMAVHTLPIRGDVGGAVSSAEMQDVYNIRMARRNSPGRKFYDQIKIQPPQGRCPLCVQRQVATVDHYLPKAHFPALAVAPDNLIPACSDCNKLKGDMIPDKDESHTLHPYFDDIDSQKWLFGEIVEENPAAFIFSVQSPKFWGPVTRKRVENHFSLFKLGVLYTNEAASELNSIRQRLTKLFASGGPLAVREHLREEARSKETDRPNSWRTAMYWAMASSNWFCSGGFAGETPLPAIPAGTEIGR